MSEHGTWVYAVTRSVEDTLLDGLVGVAGEPVRALREQGLTAVVGTVPLDTFGEEALRRNLENLDWVAEVARTHDAVVRAVATAVPAVPFRMTTVYFDDERVAALLREDDNGFGETLDRIAGRSEWGVKALMNVALLREPEPAAASGGPKSGGAGAAYLRRRRAQQNTRERIDQFAIEHADELHTALLAFAVDARRHRPHSSALAEPGQPMILNGAYLVDDTAADDFAAAVREQDARHEGVELQLTGPWPAYSFATPGGQT
jgi:Gas vesicle synthesis protein GvpL/GvpF